MICGVGVGNAVGFGVGFATGKVFVMMTTFVGVVVGVGDGVKVGLEITMRWRVGVGEGELICAKVETEEIKEMTNPIKILFFIILSKTHNG